MASSTQVQVPVNYPTAYAAGAHRHMGPLSCLSAGLPHPNQLAGIQLELPSEIHSTGVTDLIDEISDALTIRAPMHKFLLRTYLTSVHPLYNIVDESLPCLSLDRDLNASLSPTEIFISQMVYSIACHCVEGDCVRFLPLASACHRRAMVQVSAATANLDVETLRCVALMALHAMFDPRKGNLGQLVAFAARLSIDLGGYDTVEDTETTLRQLYRAIFCMESRYATVLDRPSFLPEPVCMIDMRVCARLRPFRSSRSTSIRQRRQNFSSHSVGYSLDFLA